MQKIACKILFGDRAKYLGLIFGITFATVLMAQQVSIFIGLMERTAGAIYAIPEVDIWVMDPRVRYVDEVEPLRDIELTNVRSVSGVEWAVPFYKGLATIRMPDGITQQVQLIGVDDVSLVGICHETIKGDKLAVKRPQTAMIDQNGYIFIWPGQSLEIGREIEINDNRIIIDSVCDANPTFFTFPIIYVSYSTALQITPATRNRLPFILVKASQEEDLEIVKQRIVSQTGLQALTKNEFAWRSINYVLERTGIPINFAITILLGVIIGAAITAQTFYIFVVENLKHFGAMKAIGVTNIQLLKVVLTQAGIVGVLGYSIGMGFTAFFFMIMADDPAFKGFILHWQVILGTAIVMSVVILFSIIFSLSKVFKLDPAIVFRG